jgi:hypothetical protein
VVVGERAHVRSRREQTGQVSIADINWVAFYSVIVGAVLTALFTYLVATVGRPTGRRPNATPRHRTPCLARSHGIRRPTTVRRHDGADHLRPAE